MMKEETVELLIERLESLNIYELERLRDCFAFELTIEPENAENIEDIIRHIEIVMDKKANGKQ